MLALLAVLAFAQDDRASRDALQDTLLVEAADHAVVQATRNYEVLVKNLGADDPVRSEALYWLGRARYEQGEVGGARDALRECVRTGGMRSSCLELLGRIELEQGAIREIPAEWTFDRTTHGFLHPWRYADKGAIRLAPGQQGDPGLAWRTTVDARGDDQLWVGFDSPDPAPRGVRFLLWSDRIESWIRLHASDIHGRRYSTPQSFRVPAGEMIVVDVHMDELEPEDPATPPLDPAELYRLTLQDVTAYHGAARGDNELFLDDFQVY